MQFFDLKRKEKLDWNLAVRALDNNDFAGSLFLFKRLAQEGDHVALGVIGKIYDVGGNGVVRSTDKAIHWYLQAIEKMDSCFAHLELAKLYLREKRSIQELQYARYHFEILDDHNGHSGALYHLGFIYEKGLGVEKNTERALEYYRRSENKGHLTASIKLMLIEIKKKPELFKLLKLIVLVVKTHVVRFKNKEDPNLGLEIEF